MAGQSLSKTSGKLQISVNLAGLGFAVMQCLFLRHAVLQYCSRWYTVKRALSAQLWDAFDHPVH